MWLITAQHREITDVPILISVNKSKGKVLYTNYEGIWYSEQKLHTFLTLAWGQLHPLAALPPKKVPQVPSE
jgi:hypothetical protein